MIIAVALGRPESPSRAIASLAVPIVADSVSDAGDDAGRGAGVVAKEPADDVGDDQPGRGDDRRQRRLLEAVALQAAEELRSGSEADREQEQQEEALLDLARHLHTQLADGDTGEQRAGDRAEREAPELHFAQHVADPEHEEERHLGMVREERRRTPQIMAALSAGRGRWRGRRLRRPERHHITARDRAHRPADVVVDVVVEVGERDAHRPVGRLEAAAVQEHDAVVLGEPEHDVERMDMRLHPRDDVVAAVLAQPELEVDEAVVPVEQRVGRDLDAQARRSSPATRLRTISMQACW